MKYVKQYYMFKVFGEMPEWKKSYKLKYTHLNCFPLVSIVPHVQHAWASPRLGLRREMRDVRGMRGLYERDFGFSILFLSFISLGMMNNEIRFYLLD